MKPESVDGALKAVPAIPVDHDGPVFAEPYEAQAFAMTVALYEAGHFSWDQWANMLGTVIAREEASGSQLTYYECWMLALETMVQDLKLSDVNEMADRKEAWDRAARSTPHGMPIEL